MTLSLTELDQICSYDIAKLFLKTIEINQNMARDVFVKKEVIHHDSKNHFSWTPW